MGVEKKKNGRLAGWGRAAAIATAVGVGMTAAPFAVPGVVAGSVAGAETISPGTQFPEVTEPVFDKTPLSDLNVADITERGSGIYYLPVAVGEDDLRRGEFTLKGVFSGVQLSGSVNNIVGSWEPVSGSEDLSEYFISEDGDLSLKTKGGLKRIEEGFQTIVQTNDGKAFLVELRIIGATREKTAPVIIENPNGGEIRGTFTEDSYEYSYEFGGETSEDA